ncbi:MAG: TonB-dependent receptor plug domain-containing protein [Mucilaginibacter sp.]
METITHVIARNEIIYVPCQSPRRNIIWGYLPRVHVLIFCLLLSLGALAQSSDTSHKAASKKTSKLGPKSDPMIILDDVVYKGPLSNINPDDIHDITVLKGNSATALYGQGAVMGAVVIKTKKYTSALAQLNTLHTDTTGAYQFREPGATPFPSKALVVLDDVIYKGNIKSIDPSTIASIVVLKGAKAEALYGLKGAAGVIVIKTKKYQKADTTIKINLR